MRVAADRLTAIAVIRQQFRLIANPDLSHLDPGVELLGESFHEFPEIDAILGQIVEDQTLFSEQVFGIDELHLELVFPDERFAAQKLIPFLAVEIRFDDMIVGGRLAKDRAALLLLTEIGAGLLGRRSEDFPPFDAPFTPDDDGGVPRKDQLPLGEKLSDGSGQPVTNDISIGHNAA